MNEEAFQWFLQGAGGAVSLYAICVAYRWGVRIYGAFMSPRINDF